MLTYCLLLSGEIVVGDSMAYVWRGLVKYRDLSYKFYQTRDSVLGYQKARGCRVSFWSSDIISFSEVGTILC